MRAGVELRLALRNDPHGDRSPTCGGDGDDQIVDGGALIGRRRPETGGEPTVRVDHEVTAELSEVLYVGATPSAAAPQEVGVHPQRARVPHLSAGAPTEIEAAVELAFGIAEQRVWQLEVRPMRSEVFGRGEGDGRDRCVTELVEAIAHGDQVLLARQSHEVTVEDQQRRTARLIGQPPGRTPVVDQLDVVESFADLHVVPPRSRPVVRCPEAVPGGRGTTAQHRIVRRPISRLEESLAAVLPTSRRCALHPRGLSALGSIGRGSDHEGEISGSEAEPEGGDMGSTIGWEGYRLPWVGHRLQWSGFARRDDTPPCVTADINSVRGSDPANLRVHGIELQIADGQSWDDETSQAEERVGVLVFDCERGP